MEPTSSTLLELLGTVACRLRSATDILEQSSGDLSSSQWGSLYMLRDIVPLVDRAIAKCPKERDSVTRETGTLAGRFDDLADDIIGISVRFDEAQALFARFRDDGASDLSVLAALGAQIASDGESACQALADRASEFAVLVAS